MSRDIVMTYITKLEQDRLVLLDALRELVATCDAVVCSPEDAYEQWGQRNLAAWSGARAAIAKATGADK